jgi:hypothetical protein
VETGSHDSATVDITAKQRIRRDVNVSVSWDVTPCILVYRYQNDELAASIFVVEVDANSGKEYHFIWYQK